MRPREGKDGGGSAPCRAFRVSDHRTNYGRIYGADLVDRIGRDKPARVEHVERTLDPQGLDLVPTLEQLRLGDAEPICLTLDQSTGGDEEPLALGDCLGRLLGEDALVVNQHEVVGLAQLAGLRKAEFLGLRWRDVDSSRLAMAGVDLLTVKELGGWKSLTMVQRYAHLSRSHRREAIERLALRRPEPTEATGTGNGVAP